MPSWIWMKGIDKAVTATVQDPLSPDDDRPSVPELMEEHAENIEKVKKDLQEDPSYEEGKHDDLWILRFLLSHKQKTKRALKVAKDSLLFRKKYHLDDQDIRSLAPHKVSEEDEVPHFSYLSHSWQLRCGVDGIVCTIPDKQRGVIFSSPFPP